MTYVVSHGHILRAAMCVSIAALFGVVIFCPSSALADRWGPLRAEAYKPGVGVCHSEADRTACLVVRCDPDDGLELLLFDDGEGGIVADDLTFKIGTWVGSTKFKRLENGDVKRGLASSSPLFKQLLQAREIRITNVEWGYDLTFKNVTGANVVNAFSTSCRS